MRGQVVAIEGRTRHFLAVICGVVVFLALYKFAFIGGDFVLTYVHPVKTIPEWEKLGVHRDQIIRRADVADLYTELSWVGLCLAAAASATMLLWERRRTDFRLVGVFWAFLIVLIPMSLANFWSFDQFVMRSVQTGLNVMIAFCGVVCVATLFELPLDSTVARVLRAFVSFFLVMQAVLIPMLYAILWWANWQKFISLAATQDFSPGWATALTGAVSLAFTIYKFVVEGNQAASNAKKALQALDPGREPVRGAKVPRKNRRTL